MIEIRNISKWYGAFQVLKDCTTRVSEGEVVVVCGPSGSGKSTLIKCVNGLEPFQAGEVLVNGVSVGDPHTNLPKLRAHIGMVFQNFELFPHMTVLDNINLAQIKVLGRDKDAATERSYQLLKRVGLEEQASKHPGQLSGGQQQRVAIARALVNQPALLLADEPTGNLDSQTSIEIMGVFQKLNHEGITIVMVTHELDIARYARRNVIMRDGRIVTDTPVTNRLKAEQELERLRAEQQAVQLAP